MAVAMSLRASEWIALAYFACLGAAAVARPVAAEQRQRALGAVLVVAAVILGLARVGTPGPTAVLRDWLPLAYLLLGYRLPALLVTAPHEPAERVLAALDDRWIGRRRLAAWAEHGPRAVIELLELAYLWCYPLVPAGLACLYAAGLRSESDRFWTAVLLAAYASYGVLPWLPTRPPRALERPPVRSRSRIRLLNLRVLDRASIHLNTFPSGHAAASVATALAVGAELPGAGLVLGLIALGIAAGSVLGRYHYAADALAGALLALAGFAVSRLV